MSVPLLSLAAAADLGVSLGWVVCLSAGGVEEGEDALPLSETFLEGRRSRVAWRVVVSAASFLRSDGVLVTAAVFLRAALEAAGVVFLGEGELRPLWRLLEAAAVGLGRVLGLLRLWSAAADDLVDALEGVRERSLLLEATELVGETACFLTEEAAADLLPEAAELDGSLAEN